MRIIVGRFCISFELCLSTLDVGLESLPDEREIDESREYPSDETDHDSSTDERSESSRDSCDEVGPEHLPGRAYILHEFFESYRFDSIDKSLDSISLLGWEFLYRDLFFCRHILDLCMFLY